MTTEVNEPEPEVGERPEKMRALAMPDLRPYADPKAVAHVAWQGIAASRKPAASVARRTAAGIAAVARSFWAGNRTLASLLYGWLTGAHGKQLSIPARLGAVVVILLATAHTIAEHRTRAVLGVAGVWLLVAVTTASGKLDRILGKKKEQPKAPEKTPEKGQETDPHERRRGLARLLRQTPEQAPAATPVKAVDQAPAEAPVEAAAEPPLIALIRELTGDDNGVHLGVLRPAMRERLPGLAEAGDKQLRQVLREAGFDPSRTFRARGVAGRAGVHRSELPPLPSPGSRPEDSPRHSPPPESGADLRKSPVAESAPESGRRGRKGVPEGWTEEEVAKRERWVNDPERGPHAWIRERLEGVD
ncbi:hypothetical protein ABT300_18935 [Streptomyces sp. NPDC001027]|uniref:hypothetical protein n=1 Tax=Streptomyces sp. NPDC001027 TaxID=3154771 RepID=UPI00331963DA